MASRWSSFQETLSEEYVGRLGILQAFHSTGASLQIWRWQFAGSLQTPVPDRDGMRPRQRTVDRKIESGFDMGGSRWAAIVEQKSLIVVDP